MKRPSLLIAGWLVACALITGAPSLAASAPTDDIGFSIQPVPRVDDPAADGWQTETLNKTAGKQLKHLAHFLEAAGSDDVRAELQAIVAPSFSSGPLKPADTTVTYDGSYLKVIKEKESPDAGKRSLDNLAAALEPLVNAVHDASDIQVKFKIVGVDISRHPAVTEQLFSLNGKTPGGAVEIHSSWRTEWTSADDGKPLLVRIDSSGYQESHIRGVASSTLFSDCTRSVLEGNESFEKQLLHGPDHWLTRIEAAMGTSLRPCGSTTSGFRS